MIVLFTIIHLLKLFLLGFSIQVMVQMWKRRSTRPEWLFWILYIPINLMFFLPQPDFFKGFWSIGTLIEWISIFSGNVTCFSLFRYFRRLGPPQVTNRTGTPYREPKPDLLPQGHWTRRLHRWLWNFSPELFEPALKRSALKQKT